MKKSYNTHFMKFTHFHPGKLVIIFGLLLWFIPVIMAQEYDNNNLFDPVPLNEPTCEGLVYTGTPLVDNPYDGKKTAYITTGLNGGTIDDPVNWMGEFDNNDNLDNPTDWLKCFSQGQDIGIPPDYNINKTDLYIQISAGDYIEVDLIEYSNQVTIVVCGYLKVGDFAVLEPIIFYQFLLSLGDDKSLSPTAAYESDFQLKQDGYTYGFSIVPQGDEYDIFDPAHRIYPLDTEYFNNTYWDEYDGDGNFIGDFGFNNLTHWKDFNDETDESEMILFQSGVTYEIVPFIEDQFGDALYYVSQIMSFNFSATKNGENKTMILAGSEQNPPGVKSEDDGGVILNNVNIIICPGGYLEATSLDLKNSVAIYNYGTLQAGSITGQGSASTQCITGTGSFLDLEGESIIIYDQVKDEWHVNGNYVSDIDPDGKLGWKFGDNCESFPIALPIELYSFDSKVYPEHIELNWVTASEINNDFFTLERSSDLYAWEIVGHLQGAGTTSEKRHYSYNDYSPREGISYYRLKQTDFDGQFEYFGPLSVMYMPGADGLDFRIARHPDQWTLHVPGEGAYHVELYDLTGRKIFSDMVVNNITIPAPNQTVVVRVFNDRHHSASRVVMQ